ncbi:MAG: hypothetical protein WBQ09_11650 [Terriglobales bacterium]|jgi:hypothetical protein
MEDDHSWKAESDPSEQTALLEEISGKLDNLGQRSGIGLWLIVIWFLLWPTVTPVTLNKVWYGLTSGVGYSHVLVTRQSTDCDWGHAPLGSKGCRYDKQVAKLNRLGNVAESGEAVTDVYVGWEKIDEGTQ